MTTKNARTAAMQADSVTSYAVPGSSDYLLKSGGTITGSLAISSGTFSISNTSPVYSLYNTATGGEWNTTLTSGQVIFDNDPNNIVANSKYTFKCDGSIKMELESSGVLKLHSTGSEGGQMSLYNKEDTAAISTLDIASDNSTRLFTTINDTELTLGQLVGTGGTVGLYTEGSRKVLLSSSGALGIGVVPSAWGVGAVNVRGVDISNVGSVLGSTSWGAIGGNIYYNGSTWKFKTTGYASLLTTGLGSCVLYMSSTSGVANDTVTLANIYTADYTGDFVLNKGRIGYGAGAGGSITQTGSKSTPVTLNKPSGHIVTHNATLSAGAAVLFTFNNSYIGGAGDVLLVNLDAGGITSTAYYNVWCSVGSGAAIIALKNIHSAALAETVTIRFAVVKGSIS